MSRLQIDLFLDGRRHGMRRWDACPRMGETVFVQHQEDVIECTVVRVVHLIQFKLEAPHEIDLYLERAANSGAAP